MSGTDRPLGAAARARLRVQGHARVGDARRGRGRRDQPRVSAGHRSAARRAGLGRDAEASGPLAQPGARLPDRCAHRRLEGRRADRDGRAGRSRLRRVLASRVAAHGHGRAAARDAVRGNLRPSRLAASAGSVSRQVRRRARRRSRNAPRVARDTLGRRNDRAGDDLRIGPRNRRPGPPVSTLHCRRRGPGTCGESRRRCR